MNMFISKEKPNGLFRDIELHSGDYLPQGFLSVPEELREKVLASRGYCGLVLDEDGNLTDVTPRPRPKPPEPTPAENRKLAYQTEKIIEWNGEMITVDAANQLWLQYAAEEDARAAELTELIVSAKVSIREMYPDQSAAGGHNGSSVL